MKNQESTASIIRKIDAVLKVIETQVPVEVSVVFGDFQEQPFRSIWDEDELPFYKNKLKELVEKL